jgi:hypothetical protein
LNRLLSILFLILLLISCTPPPTGRAPAVETLQSTLTSLPSTASEAQGALVKFFELLNSKQYAEAESLYGGSFEGLQDNNPGVDPSDHVKLLENACEINGHQCLLARTVTFTSLQGNTYIFQVEFSNPDSTLFVLGPCCGANETEMPPVSQFEYSVTKNSNGKFVVMDLPPDVP